METRKLPKSYRRLGRLRLIALEGPDSGQTYTLDFGETPTLTGGRSRANDVVLADEHISDVHFRLTADREGTLGIHDENSLNGIYVQGVRVDSGSVELGAAFRVGNTTLKLLSTEQVDVELPLQDHFGELYGQSDVMREVYGRLERIAARVDRIKRVLVGGETGTGKELVARGLHKRSVRRDAPFIVLDCTSISSELAEAKLFGHKKNAFTNASAATEGCFEAASGGTLFLDEVGELPLAQQAKLLRVLNDGEVVRIGEHKSRKVDVFVIAATHRDLRKMVGDGSFREDLYFRLKGVRVDLPPLRERGDDVTLLAQRFLRESIETNQVPSVRLTQEALEALQTCDWPGNVRQLRLAIEVAAMMCESGTIHSRDLEIEDASEVPRRMQGLERLLKMNLASSKAGFERIYFTYLRSQYRTKREMAEAAGLTKEGLRQALRRLSLDF